MERKPLIGISICAVVLLVMASLTNVVGYQTVKSSNQQTITETVNQRELLFQTICDITNNKEIQRIILKSQMSRGIFPVSDTPVLTKNQLKQMYFLGLILSKFISKSRMQSMIQQYQLINPEIQTEISAVIEKDATLNTEITQLKNSECDCENENTARLWHFPVICNFSFLLFWIGVCFYPLTMFAPLFPVLRIMGGFIFLISAILAFSFNCDWIDIPEPIKS